MNAPVKILVVDDDRDIVRSIQIYLSQAGYEVLCAYDGLQALEIARDHDVRLILMDIMMPKMDGIDATLRIREEKNIPIILVSAKSEDADKILGLGVGADDYITKPFSPMELIARVKAALRRYMQLGSMEKRPDVLVNGGLTMDTLAKTVTVDGEEVRFTATEYKILELFMKNPGRVMSIDEIYSRVWQEPSVGGDNTVAVHIRRIREKIEINPGQPRYLKVVWGIGYKLERLEK